jgi:RNA polymerase sigma factor (sigma-70 family)
MLSGMGEEAGPGLPAGAGREFTTTHWSVVLAAGNPLSPEVGVALETLCRVYWYPLYAYVRRKGYSAQNAQDLTQEFFTRLLDKNALAHVQREGGKFRSFLLTALKHFLVNEWEHDRAQKRDEQKVAFSLDELEPESRFQFEPADTATPETLFERQWAATLLAQVMDRLRDEHARAGKADLFQRLQPCLTGAERMIPYANLASLLGMTDNAVKMAVHRLRKRYGELLRAEIADMVADPLEVEAEIRHLIAVSAQ